MQLQVLLTLLGLMGPSVGLLPQKLDFSHSKTELNHLVVDETSGVVCLGADQQHQSASAAGPVRRVTRHVWQPFQGNSNKYCHYRSNPPTLVSLKSLPCNAVEKPKIFTIRLFTEKVTKFDLDKMRIRVEENQYNR